MTAPAKIARIKEKYPNEIIETHYNAHNRMYITRIRNVEYTTRASDQSKARADLDLLYNSLMYPEPTILFPCCQGCYKRTYGQCDGIVYPQGKDAVLGCDDYDPFF